MSLPLLLIKDFKEQSTANLKIFSCWIPEANLLGLLLRNATQVRECKGFLVSFTCLFTVRILK